VVYGAVLAAKIESPVCAPDGPSWWAKFAEA
jgi:hypothetical protein